MGNRQIEVMVVGPTNLGTYHLARFNALVDAGLELTVVRTPIREFYRPWQVELDQARFQIEQPYHGLNSRARWTKLLKQTKAYLAQKEPQAVICVGYNSKYIWSMSLCCRQLSVPLILYLVGWKKERRRTWWREWVKRFYCRHYFGGAVVTGTRSAAYAQKLGIDAAMIWKAGNVVDNQHFAQGKPQASLLDRGSNEPLPFFLTVSRLHLNKNVSTLLRAFSLYRANGGAWHLAIAGTGPEEAKLKSLVPTIDKDAVHWLGWKDYQDLPDVYASASCFVLPSIIEPWGLVVNEAMAAGLPVLVSRACGCVPELCWRGINGYDFDPYDVGELAGLMLKMASEKEECLTLMGRASSQSVSIFSLQNWSKAVADCAKSFMQELEG